MNARLCANTTFHNMLAQASDSVLIVVDVQAYFLEKVPVHQRVVLVSRIAWLMRAADCLDVPIIATAENIPALGQLLPALKTLLRSGGPVYDKLSFGLLAQTDIREAFEALDKNKDWELSFQELAVAIDRKNIKKAQVLFRQRQSEKDPKSKLRATLNVSEFRTGYEKLKAISVDAKKKPPGVKKKK